MLPDDRYIEKHGEDDVRVTGTRVGIEHVLWAYRSGMLAEEVAAQFPTVPLDAVHGLIAYYLRHRRSVDVYLAQWRRTARQNRARQAAARPSPVVGRLR